MTFVRSLARTWSGRWLCLIATLAATAALPGCDSATSPTRGAQPIQYVMQFYTAEGDAARYLLLVGETDSILVGSTAACPDSIFAVLRSSDPSVVALFAPTMRPWGGMPPHCMVWVPFVGKAPGSVRVSVSTLDSWKDSARVDVVATPLPVDSIRVRLWPNPPPQPSTVTAVTDAAGNVVSMTLSACINIYGYICQGSQFPLRTLAFRGGDSTVYLPGTYEVSDSSVVGSGAGMTAGGGHGLWLGARSRRTTTVTVTARNQKYSFLLTVQ
jgi:hypothetical protein